MHKQPQSVALSAVARQQQERRSVFVKYTIANGCVLELGADENAAGEHEVMRRLASQKRRGEPKK
jgi:hypothetical protein